MNSNDLIRQTLKTLTYYSILINIRYLITFNQLHQWFSTCGPRSPSEPVLQGGRQLLLIEIITLLIYVKISGHN